MPTIPRTFISSHRWLWLVVACAIAILPWGYYSTQLFLVDPPVLQDEAIIFDTSQTLASTGQLASHIYGNLLPRMEQHSFGYPPLYYYLLAGWIRIAGDSVESGRALSIVWGASALIIFFVLCRLLTRSLAPAFWTTFLLSADFFFGGATRTIRMDIVSFVFVLSAVTGYLAFLKSKKHFLWTIAGICSGFAILTHPLGMIAPLTIIVDMFIRRHAFLYRRIGSMIALVGLAIALWILSVTPSIESFIGQQTMQFYTKAISPSALVFMWQTNALDRLFLIVTIATYGAYLLWYRHNTHPYKQEVLVYSLVSLTGVTIGKEQLYIVYLAPCIYLLLLIMSDSALQKHRRGVLLTCLGLALSHFLIHLSYNMESVKQIHNNIIPYHKWSQIIAQNLPPHTVVLLTTHPDPYFDLRKNPSYSLIEFPMVLMPPDTYAPIWQNIDYIVANLENNELNRFIQTNAASVVRIGSTKNGYQTLVIKLKPEEERRW